MLNVVMLNVSMLNVIILSVVAPSALICYSLFGEDLEKNFQIFSPLASKVCLHRRF
jgi:hypothetical protein